MTKINLFFSWVLFFISLFNTRLIKNWVQYFLFIFYKVIMIWIVDLISQVELIEVNLIYWHFSNWKKIILIVLVKLYFYWSSDFSSFVDVKLKLLIFPIRGIWKKLFACWKVSSHHKLMEEWAALLDSTDRKISLISQ